MPLLGYGSTHVGGYISIVNLLDFPLQILVLLSLIGQILALEDINISFFLSFSLILSCGLLFALIGHFGLLKDIKIFLSLSLPISTCIFQSDIAILLQREILHMEHSKV